MTKAQKYVKIESEVRAINKNVINASQSNRMDMSTGFTSVPVFMNAFHFHSMRELVFVGSGHSEIITESGSFSADGPFVMQFPEGMLHMQKNSPDVPYVRWQTLFIPDFLKKLFGDRVPDDFFIVRLQSDTARRFSQIFGMLLEFSDQEFTDSVCERCQFLVAAIYSELIPLIPKTAAEVCTSSQKRIFDICRYIDSNFSQKLTLDMISREFFIGRATLVREFRQILGTTVGEYIQNVRISKAKRMLLQGMTISETSEKCGYANPSYFVQVFRHAIGVTPTAFVSQTMKLIGDE